MSLTHPPNDNTNCEHPPAQSPSLLCPMAGHTKAAGRLRPAPPDITLQEEAAVPQVGRAPQAASHLPVFLHDLDHLTHGCKGTEGEAQCVISMLAGFVYAFQSG